MAPLEIDYGSESVAPYAGYYKHSGKVNFSSVAGSLTVGLAAGFGFAWVYALAVLYIPIVQLNVLSVAGFGLATGAVPAWVMRKLKGRSVPIALAVVGVTTAFAYYISWASWESMLLGDLKSAPSFLQIVTDPPLMLALGRRINEIGTWKLTSTSEKSFNGAGLALIWLVEAAIVFCSALFFSRRFSRDLPFCERCNRWCSKQVLVSTGIGDHAAIRELLEARDFAFLPLLGRAEFRRWTEFVLHYCDKCRALHMLSVMDVTTSSDRHGREHRHDDVFVDKLLISKEDVQALLPPAPVPSSKPAQSPASQVPATPPKPLDPNSPAARLARMFKEDEQKGK